MSGVELDWFDTLAWLFVMFLVSIMVGGVLHALLEYFDNRRVRHARYAGRSIG